MYLLDSICKNVGAPYTTCFGINLYRTFADAYTQVPESIRRKLVELYGTWKTSSTGSALFPAEPMRKISSFLERINEIAPSTQPGRSPVPGGPPGGPGGPQGAVTQPYLLEKCTHVLDMTSDRLQHIPGDTDAKERLPVLSQLHTMLQTQAIPPSYLPDIQAQLASSLAHEEQKLAEYQREQERLAQQQQQRQQQQQQPKQQQAQATPAGLFASLQAAGLLGGMANGGAAPVTPPLGMGAGLPDMSGMPYPFPGMVGLPGMPPFMPPLQGAVPGAPVVPGAPDLSSLLASGASSLLSSLESNNVELSTSSLQKPRPNLVFNLYGKMPKQCNICGRRFRDNQDNARQAHMDWHFRVNKKMRQDESRAQNRRWYLTEHLWVEGGEQGEQEEVAEKPRIDMDAVRKQWVLAPSAASKKKQLCPICKSGFNTELSDEAEDWVWTDAVQIGDKIFHATCHAESGKLADTIVRKRNRGDGGGAAKKEKLELDY